MIFRHHQSADGRANFMMAITVVLVQFGFKQVVRINWKGITLCLIVYIILVIKPQNLPSILAWVGCTKIFLCARTAVFVVHVTWSVHARLVNLGGMFTPRIQYLDLGIVHYAVVLLLANVKKFWSGILQTGLVVKTLTIGESILHLTSIM